MAAEPGEIRPRAPNFADGATPLIPPVGRARSLP